MPGQWGCYECFKGNAPYVWKKRPFIHVACGVDDSHFSINIVACRRCGQRCVKVFTEFVDWTGGDDAQYWLLVPLAGDEADELIAQGAAINISRIEAISKDRPCLQVDHPTGEEKRIRWAQGPVFIVTG